MRRQSAKDKELEDNARLLRAWRNWHAEELAEALTGPHRHIVAPLMEIVKRLDPQSSKTLINYIRAQNWRSVDAQTKLVCLHEINESICRLRVRHNMQPINDALWGEPATAFQVIRSIVIPIEGKPAEGLFGQTNV